MPVQITVPDDAMMRPGVAIALAQLVRALGSAGNGAHAPEPDTVRQTRTGSRSGPSRPEAPRRKSPSRPGSNRTPPPDLSHLPPAERWTTYVSTLPEKSQRFVGLLEARGRLTVDEVVRALDLDTPKALGGLTGAMARWAPRQGVTLPFTKKQNGNGERYWEWVGY